MDMRLVVSYIPCAKSLREQTSDIITFTQFEEVNILSNTRNYAESGDKYDADSIMSPLISKEEMDAVDSGDHYDDQPMSAEMLEDIRDGSKSHTSINRRDSGYKIRDRIKQIQTE